MPNPDSNDRHHQHLRHRKHGFSGAEGRFEIRAGRRAGRGLRKSLVRSTSRALGLAVALTLGLPGLLGHLGSFRPLGADAAEAATVAGASQQQAGATGTTTLTGAAPPQAPHAPPGQLPPLLPPLFPGAQPSLPSPLPDLLPQPVKDLMAQLMPPNAVPEAGPKPAQTEPAPYWGLGSWVDLYDYGHPGNSSPEAIVDEMASRGVRTVYVQTARWNSTDDIEDPGAVGGFLHRAHDKGMKVVGWYMPGFADLDLDIRRSMAILQYKSARGDQFDGLAPDIEDRAAVGGSRDAFNAGIVAYSQRLRAAVPQGTVLAAIVPDVKNNERAPNRWAGFPWPEIARDYDVVMPMAYWTVAKPLRNCTSIQMDAGAYTREVMAKTVQLMGTSKPIHIIGGIADCTTPQEVQAYAEAARQTGAIGGGLYDWVTNTQNVSRETLWSAQTPLR